jgi:hypothetical protein
MIQQSNNNRRNRSRPNVPRDTRPTEAGQQSQWQRKYDHHRHLAQATGGEDAVARELHWQYAEHFLRLINGSAT